MAALRGTYQLQVLERLPTRRFEIREGTIEFAGTPGIDPNLDITPATGSAAHRATRWTWSPPSRARSRAPGPPDQRLGPARERDGHRQLPPLRPLHPRAVPGRERRGRQHAGGHARPGPAHLPRPGVHPAPAGRRQPGPARRLPGPHRPGVRVRRLLPGHERPRRPRRPPGHPARGRVLRPPRHLRPRQLHPLRPRPWARSPRPNPCSTPAGAPASNGASGPPGPELYWEDRFARTPSFSYDQIHDRTVGGLSMFREWGY
jgi:hypothetical protein